MGLQSGDRLSSGLNSAGASRWRTVSVDVQEEIGIASVGFGDIDQLRCIAVVNVFSFHPGISECRVADSLERLDIDADLLEPVSDLLIVASDGESSERCDKEENEQKHENRPLTKRRRRRTRHRNLLRDNASLTLVT